MHRDDQNTVVSNDSSVAYSAMAQRIQNRYARHRMVSLFLVGGAGVLAVYWFVFIVFGRDANRDIAISNKIGVDKSTDKREHEVRELIDPLHCAQLFMNATINSDWFKSHAISCDSGLRTGDACKRNLLLLCDILKEESCGKVGFGSGGVFQIATSTLINKPVSISSSLYANCGQFSALETGMFVFGSVLSFGVLATAFYLVLTKWCSGFQSEESEQPRRSVVRGRRNRGGELLLTSNHSANHPERQVQSDYGAATFSV